MPFIVDKVCRLTVHQTYGGREVNNVLDFFIDVGGTPSARAAVCEAQAGKVLDAWHDQMRVSQVNDVSCDFVSWLDLDDADGSVGIVTETGDNTWPANGAGTGDPMPGNVSALYTKVLESSGRSRRNGRMYLCGLSEAFTPATGPNLIDATTLATLTTRGDDFMEAANATFGADAFDSNFAVTHILTYTTDVNGRLHPATGDSINVSSFFCNAVLATQRRRLRA